MPYRNINQLLESINSFTDSVVTRSGNQSLYLDANMISVADGSMRHLTKFHVISIVA